MDSVISCAMAASIPHLAAQAIDEPRRRRQPPRGLEADLDLHTGGTRG